MGLNVEGLGLKAWGLGLDRFRVGGLRFQAWGLRFRRFKVEGLRFRASPFEAPESSGEGLPDSSWFALQNECFLASEAPGRGSLGSL